MMNNLERVKSKQVENGGGGGYKPQPWPFLWKKNDKIIHSFDTLYEEKI